jgi:urea transporter
LKKKIQIKLFSESILNSYSQVFFSDNHLFALVLIFASFINFNTGLAGLAAVVLSNCFSWIIGLDRNNLKQGYYGFNSLLVGLGLGHVFQPTVTFYILLVFIALLTVFITVAFSGIIGKYGLPYLSIPFLFSFWIVTLGTRHFEALTMIQKRLYVPYEITHFGSLQIIKLYERLSNIGLNESISIYFKSLGAIFFEYHVIAGILIALGLLIYSRIAFFLSLVGFYSAYLFFHFVGGNMTEVAYSYIGFNFILTAIALGGYFIIPSVYSYLWVIALMPIIVLFTSGTTALLNIFSLPTFSFPFNLVVLMFLYVLKFRTRSISKLQLVINQENSPEKNLYSFKNYLGRFGKFAMIPIHLPFTSKWFVSQGQDGEITHKHQWKHAWDFNITDEKQSTYKSSGSNLSDYYAWNKPVIAPAEGLVVEIDNSVEDNQIGKVNTEQNWGNSIVIKHSEYLYSKISHIKKDSFKVKKGDYVKRAEVLAACGNTGRSPEPHLHFQLQATPYIGSKTLDYPINHFIVQENDKYEIQFNDKPKQGQTISNIEKNDLLFDAFEFTPGKTIKFNVNGEYVDWEVFTDSLNQSYIYEKQTQSTAWFVNIGPIHYFSNFKGDKKSLLYYFFLAAYKVPLGYYQDMEVKDQFRDDLFSKNIVLFFQDFIAPFFRLLKAEYSLTYDRIEKDLSTNFISLHSSVNLKTLNKTIKNYDFVIECSQGKISKFTVKSRKLELVAECID